MEEMGVILKMEKNRDWCAGMVVVPKPNGKIWICVDLPKLKEGVCRETYILPSVDQSLAQLNGARVFTRVEPDTRLKWVSGTDKALLPSTSIIRVIRVNINICARIEWKSSLASWLCQRSVIGYSAPPLHNADVLLCPALITHTQNSSLSLRFAGRFPLMFRVSSASGLLLLRLVLTYEPVEFWQTWVRSDVVPTCVASLPVGDFFFFFFF